MSTPPGPLASSDPFDAVVVGAGVTGATLACLLARAGRRTLLLDRAAFPRDKVCGGCLSAPAVALLAQLGLAPALRAASPRPLHRVQIHLPTARLTLPYAGAAVARSAFDAALTAAARHAGALFLDQTTARLGPLAPGFRTLHLQRGSARQTLRARLIFACDGLAGRLLDAEPALAWTIAPRSRLGIHAMLPPAALPIAADAITLHVGRGGYVGLAQLDDGRLDLAAALDPALCRAVGGPLLLVGRLLRQRGVTAPLPAVALHGAPLLTRHRRHFGIDRVLAVGDACGYVEPFTGEGMQSGITSAAAVVALLSPNADPWSENLPHRWQRLHAFLFSRALRRCRLLTRALRHPHLLGAALQTLHLLPTVARHLARAISAPRVLPPAPAP